MILQCGVCCQVKKLEVQKKLRRSANFSGKNSSIKAWHKPSNLMEKGSKEVNMSWVGIGYGEERYGVDTQNSTEAQGG